MNPTSIDFSLAGRHSVVCGSTQGFGRAIAEAFAAAVSSVTLVGRNEDGLEQVRSALTDADGQRHRTLCVDFSDWRAVQAAADRHAAEHGPVHVLINNTGGPAAGFAVDAEPTDFLKGFEMHLACGQSLVQAFAPGMREAGYGRVINIISTSVVTPIKGLGVSNTIRGAVANWGRTLAVELGGFGITVNNVLPGATATERLSTIIANKAEKTGKSTDAISEAMKNSIPAKRFAEPCEVATAIAFLASDLASYINGINLPVDGGRTKSL